MQCFHPCVFFFFFPLQGKQYVIQPILPVSEAEAVGKVLSCGAHSVPLTPWWVTSCYPPGSIRVHTVKQMELTLLSSTSLPAQRSWLWSVAI